MNKVMESSNVEMNKTLMTIIKGLAISVIFSLVAIFIFAIIISYTNFSENGVAPVMIGIVATSILIGTAVSTWKLTKNGILNGGLVGLLYMLILYLVSSSLGTGFALNTNAIIMMLLGIIAGMIGGIIGVNSGNRK